MVLGVLPARAADSACLSCTGASEQTGRGVDWLRQGKSSNVTIRRVRLPFQEKVMPFTVEAIYENGVLKPAQQLALREQQKVRLTIETIPGGP